MAQSIRQRKVADKIKDVVGIIIDRQLKDPAVGFVTVSHVKISPDLRVASIYYTVLGDEESQQNSAEALDRAKNYIRSELGQQLQLRYNPDLRFFQDDTLNYAMKIEDLLKKAKKADENLRTNSDD